MQTTANHHSILWADDDADDLWIVREIMDDFADTHQVVEAADGVQVMEYLERIDQPSALPCLVVLDMNMPIMNGKDTLINIKRNRRFDGIPVVVFTTSSSDKDRRFCERHGAEMFTKPHTYSGFQHMVSDILRRCRMKG